MNSADLGLRVAKDEGPRCARKDCYAHDGQSCHDGYAAPQECPLFRPKGQSMKIEFSPPVERKIEELKLGKLKARYGDHWSIEMTSFLGPIIHFTATSASGHAYKTRESIDRDDLRLLNEDRTRRGLAPIHDTGAWR